LLFRPALLRFRATGTIPALIATPAATASIAILPGAAAVVATPPTATPVTVAATRLSPAACGPGSGFRCYFSAILATAATSIAAATPPAATRLVVQSAAARHVELLAIEHHALANGRANFRASRTDSEHPASRMMEDLDLNLVAADAKLVERDLDRFVDGMSLNFDAGSHAASHLP
jgi:hypothetical protein